MFRFPRLLAAVLVASAISGVQLPAAAAHPGHLPGDGAADAPGALVTETGVVVAVDEVLSDGYLVTTPCLNEAFLSRGTYVQHVDVVLDPGHGGSESGSVGSNGLIERDVNLDIARRAGAILEARGYTVQLTRTRDDRVPLRARAAIANALQPDLFISIHHNGGAKRFQSTPGSEAFYQVNNDESRRFALLVYEHVKAALAPLGSSFVDTVREGANTRLRSDFSDLYGVLRNTPNLHSVIVEALYISNGPEAAMLARDEVKDAEAAAIADAVDEWYQTTNTGTADNGFFVDETTSGTGGTSGCVDPVLGFEAQPITGYDAVEFEDVRQAAVYLGYDMAEFQKAGVVVVDFIRRISGLPESEPLAPDLVPQMSRDFRVPSQWTAQEMPSLRRIADTYEIGEPEAQKLGAALLVFLVGLERSGR